MRLACKVWSLLGPVAIVTIGFVSFAQALACHNATSSSILPISTYLPYSAVLNLICPLWETMLCNIQHQRKYVWLRTTLRIEYHWVWSPSVPHAYHHCIVVSNPLDVQSFPIKSEKQQFQRKGQQKYSPAFLLSSDSCSLRMGLREAASFERQKQCRKNDGAGALLSPFHYARASNQQVRKVTG